MGAGNQAGGVMKRTIVAMTKAIRRATKKATFSSLAAERLGECNDWSVGAFQRLTLPRVVGRVLVPVATLVLVFGFAISASIYYSTRPYDPGHVALSEFENREANPRGYLFAAMGTALGCSLLFPAATMFRRSLAGGWCATGAWIYGAASVVGVVMAAFEGLPELFGLHIVLAYVTFLGLVGGLALLSLGVAYVRLRPGRGFWIGAAAVHLVAILLALDDDPLPHATSSGFWNSLAAGELGLIVLIAAGTSALAGACEENS